MADGARLQDVIARVEAAGAEPADEAAGGTLQENGASAADSAPADASTPSDLDTAPGGEAEPASPGATNAPSESELRAKLERDREKRALAAERKRAREDREAAEAARKEAEAVREKWAKLGKDGSILERVKEAGANPREVFEQMRDEALKAGTPEARIEAIEKAYAARFEAMEAQLKAERDAREQARMAATEAERERIFDGQFGRAVQHEAFAPLLEEYDPEDLYPIVRQMRDNPDVLFDAAERLGVDLGIDLTDPEAQYNIGHIFQVLTAQQAAHQAKRQRRTKRAAPTESQSEQPTEAKRPTVNGTEARNAGSTIGNDLAASSAGAPPDLSNEDHKARLKRLIERFG